MQMAARQRTILPALDSAGSLRGNAALASLSATAFALIERSLRVREFLAGEVLWRKSTAPDSVFFPLSGAISIMQPAGAHLVEVAMAGSEAAAGGFVAGEQEAAGIVALRGVFAAMPAPVFRAAAARDPELARLAANVCGWHLAQARRLAACNTICSTEARVARWLCTAADRAPGFLMVRQHDIGERLGLWRTSVSKVFARLRNADLIQHRRGKVTVQDRGRLLAHACECYAGLAPAAGPFKGDGA